MQPQSVSQINQQPIQKELMHNLEEITEINPADIAGYPLKDVPKVFMGFQVEPIVGQPM